MIQAARTNADGTILSRVRMHRFDKAGTLYARLDAPAARLTPGAWLLENASRMAARSPTSATSAPPPAAG